MLIFADLMSRSFVMYVIIYVLMRILVIIVIVFGIAPVKFACQMFNITVKCILIIPSCLFFVNLMGRYFVMYVIIYVLMRMMVIIVIVSDIATV